MCGGLAERPIAPELRSGKPQSLQATGFREFESHSLRTLTPGPFRLQPQRPRIINLGIASRSK